MGTDIFIGTGFVLEFSKFVSLFRTQHLHGIQTDAIRLYCERMSESINDNPELRRIESALSIDAVVEIITAIVNDNSAEDDILTLIQCISRVVLPLVPEEIRVFDSAGWSGGGVPIGEPVLIFGYDDCFETRMTSGGEALARTIGQKGISPDEWSVVSA